MAGLIERVGRALAEAENYAYDPVPYDRYAIAAIEATGLRDLLEEARDSLATGPSEAEVHRSGILARIDAALTE